MDAISSMKFDYVASGHYAKIIHSSTDQMDNPSVLELSKDMVPSRDITEFYYSLSFLALLLFVYC